MEIKGRELIIGGIWVSHVFFDELMIYPLFSFAVPKT